VCIVLCAGLKLYVTRLVQGVQGYAYTCTRNVIFLVFIQVLYYAHPAHPAQTLIFVAFGFFVSCTQPCTLLFTLHI
jgi:hypothetical protein